MPRVDTTRNRVKAAIFSPRNRRPKLQISEKWFRKNRPTLNVKLRQVIIDILPFEMDNERADLILNTIFDMITEAVIRGESVTIPGFGKFFPLYMKGRLKAVKIGSKKRKWSPPHYKLAWHPCAGLRNSMRDKPNGNTGTDQGT